MADPTINTKKIFYYGLYSDYVNLEEKDEDILYFCTDIKRVYKGDIDFTEQVIFDFYRPVAPIIDKLYIFSASGTAEVYDGTSWNIFAYPILGTNDIATRTLAAGSTSVTFTTPDDEVVDFYTDNGVQYKSVDVTDNNITVTYQTQPVNDAVHMRTYENTYYNTKVVSSLCLDNFQVTHQPNTTLYAVGDPVDITGIQVTGTLGETQYNLTDFIETVPPIGSPVPENTSAIRVIFGAQEVSVPINEIPAFDELVITSMPTKTVYKVVEHLDLAGLVVTAYAGNRTYSKDVTSICRIRPKNDTVLNKNNYTYTIDITYENMHTSFNVETRGPESLEDATWAEIQYALQDGSITDFASVGHTKTFTYNGHTYHAQLAAINDGTGANGTYYPAKTADFIAVELIPEQVRGSATKWSNSELRAYLNNTVYSALPSDLQDAIVPKARYYNCWGFGYDSNSREFSSDNLWLPSIYELSANNSPTGYGRGWSVENSNYCKHYELFSSQVDEDPSRIKCVVDQSSAVNYFALPASRVNNLSQLITTVTTTGKVSESTNQNYYVPICFRIG